MRVASLLVVLVACGGDKHEQARAKADAGPPPGPAFVEPRGDHAGLLPAARPVSKRKAVPASATALLMVDNGGTTPLAIDLDNGVATGHVVVDPDDHALVELERRDAAGATVQVTIGGTHRTIDLHGDGDHGLYAWSEGGAHSYVFKTQFYGTAYVGPPADVVVDGRVAFHLDRPDFFFEPLPDEITVDGTQALVGMGRASTLQRSGSPHPARCQRAGSAVICDAGDHTIVDLGPGWLDATAVLAVDLGGKADATLTIDGVAVGPLAAGHVRRLELTPGAHALAVADVDTLDADLAIGRYVFNPGGRNDYHVEELVSGTQRWKLPHRDGVFREACICGQHFFQIRTDYVLEPTDNAGGYPTRLVRGRAGEVVVPAAALKAATRLAQRLPAAVQAEVRERMAKLDPATATLCDVHAVREVIDAAQRYPSGTGLDDLCYTAE